MRLVLTQLTRRERGTNNTRHGVDQLAALMDLGLGAEDVVLLPEVVSDIGMSQVDHSYKEEMSEFAQRLGCHVVGGSYFRAAGDDTITNSGIVFDSTGDAKAHYEKKKLYSGEREFVQHGIGPQDFLIGGCRIRVFICADFFYSGFHAAPRPDLVLVAALSTSRKPSPHFSRAVWRHMAVAKAYELGAFVGVSDWTYDAQKRPSASGVAGFADPTQHDPAALFTPLDSGPFSVHTVDLAALAAFREDRKSQGFLHYDQTAEDVIQPKLQPA